MNKNVEGYVYVITNSLFPNYVKIGRTRNVLQRMKKLGTGVPESYTLLHHEMVINSSAVESKLHQAFKMNKVNGEWYKINDINKIKDKIKSIQKDIKYDCEVAHGQTLEEKIDEIFKNYGVGLDRDGMFDFVERLKRVDCRKHEEYICEMVNELLDYHPSIDECY